MPPQSPQTDITQEGISEPPYQTDIQTSDEAAGACAFLTLPQPPPVTQNTFLCGRSIGLLCALSLCVGSHYAGNALNSLKSVMKEDLGITNAQYGTLLSAVATVNTVVPIFGGVFLDAFGTGTGSIISTGCILVGTGISAVSAFAQSSYAYQLLVLGRLVYALGAGTILVAQQSILAVWFRGRGLAVAFGLQIAIGRTSSFLAAGTVVPIVNWTGHWGWALWVAFFLCCFSFATNLVYIAVARAARPETVEIVRGKVAFNSKGILRLSDVFWLVILIEAFLYGTWTPFLHMNAEMVKLRFGTTDAIAGWESSWAHVAPIFISPFLGRIIDRSGKRSASIICSAFLLLFSILLVGFTHLPPIIGMLLFSLSITVGPVAINSSPALICPAEMTGTCIGLLKAAGNAIASAADPILGYIQDRTPGKTYDYVNVIYVAVSCISILLAVLLKYCDQKIHRGILDMPETIRAIWLQNSATIAYSSLPSSQSSSSTSSRILTEDEQSPGIPPEFQSTDSCYGTIPDEPVPSPDGQIPVAALRKYVYLSILASVILFDWILLITNINI